MQTGTDFRSRRQFRAAATRLAASGAAAAALLVALPPQDATATSIAPPSCKPGNDKTCYKEIRIINNTNGTIYAIIQGSIQTNPAINCAKGDVWLQRALGDTKNCYVVANDYYAYVNPVRGILKGETVSVMVPWWSALNKDRDPKADSHVDWWRGGRIYIFDDQTALNDSYKVNAGRRGQSVAFASGSPAVKCNTATKNACSASELKIYRVQPEIPGSAIMTQSPNQLNEWTFADVGPLAAGAELTSLNLNYNVSNVDQLYLPVAMEPIAPGYKIGYMGTLMSVTDWRARLVTFTGANANQTSTTNWPIYNNPIDAKTKKRRYPNAGIRVPSTLAAFNYYMSPAYIDGNTKLPEIIPLPTPFDRTKLPKLIRNIEVNWQNCTTAPYKNCPLKDWYTPIKQSFDKSYKTYLAKCWGNGQGPSYMAPLADGLPKLETYMRFLHGWVPFRVDKVGGKGACTAADVPDLPQTNEPPSQMGYAPVNYMKLQYDFEQLGAKGAQMFNPYTQLIHGSLADGFLNASAYAFSIDDHESFQNHPGSGLIFAVGGGNGLPNKKKVPPAVPQFYEWYTAGVSLGKSPTSAGWKSYGICASETNREFSSDDPGTIGLNPKTTPSPCMITLRDTNNKKYQIKIMTFNATGTMPYQIWPEFTATGPKPFDPRIVVCPNTDDWCKYTNETARRTDPNKPNKAPTFTLGTRAPN
ncbi:hypothetical protein [Xanthobacter agilis]|uniref:hypothetical protein n=1 Tax=Xanthobacter agilis TaxID=47492 RepID=UPI0037273AD1